MSSSLWEHPDALFVKVRIKAGWGGRRRHQARRASATTWHLQPGKTQNGVPAGPAPVWVKRLGEEGALQARLGPHPISSFSSELHHPGSLAPNSQLPLCSISRCRVLPFLGTFQKSNSHSDILNQSVCRYIFTGVGDEDEIHLPVSTSGWRADQHAPVPSGEHAERNFRSRWHCCRPTPTNFFAVVGLAVGLRLRMRRDMQWEMTEWVHKKNIRAWGLRRTGQIGMWEWR